MAHDHADIFDRGLQFDLSTLMGRRRLLGMLAGVGVAAVAGCAADTPTSMAGAATGSPPGASGTTASGNEIPEETTGPYPGDGSNGPDVLTSSGIVRRDIRSSFGSGSAVAAGVTLTITLTVLDLAGGSAPLKGGAVYLWHCDRDGRYSLYSPGVTDQNYLRGVQEIDATGTASFTSIFPGCYAGRWPHIHFEVYRSLTAATSAGSTVATSQIALPKDACDQVYATDGYAASAANLTRVSLATDNVFRDGWADELGTVTGSVTSGLAVALRVPVR